MTDKQALDKTMDSIQSIALTWSASEVLRENITLKDFIDLVLAHTQYAEQIGRLSSIPYGTPLS